MKYHIRINQTHSKHEWFLFSGTPFGWYSIPSHKNGLALYSDDIATGEHQKQNQSQHTSEMLQDGMGNGESMGNQEYHSSEKFLYFFQTIEEKWIFD